MARREALALLPALPWAARLAVQSTPARLRQVHPGTSHELIIDPDGTLKVWSSALTTNGNGELGLEHFNPVPRCKLFTVPGLSNVVKAGAGRDTSFAVLADGRVMAWGARGWGILGITPLSYVEERAEDGPNAPRPTPVAVPFDAVDLSVGDGHLLALARDGTVWSWGDGSAGQLGIGDHPIINFKTHRPAAMRFMTYPMQIPGLKDVVAVAAGRDHSMAITRNGTLFTWGGNGLGQLGDGTTVARNTPVPVPRVGNVIAIAAEGMSGALLADGRALSWGDDGSPSPALIPKLVPGVTGGRTIAAHAGTVLVLTKAGTVTSWGWSPYGAAGQGVHHNASIPVPPGPVKGLTGVHAATIRAGRGVAVLDTGRIMVWGSVPLQTPDGGVDSSDVPIPLVIDGLENG